MFTDLGPAFSVGIAIPDKYGLMVVDIKNFKNYGKDLLTAQNWSVHPDWIYCDDNSGNAPEDVVRDCIKRKDTSTLLCSI